MNKKKYIKPEVTVVDVEFESALMGMSNERPGGEGTNPDAGKDDPWEGGLDAKDDGGSSDIWGDEW